LTASTLVTRLMCANWYLSWLLTCIGDTPYVCLHFILLSSPTAADVTKIAHRERVSNGTLPKLGRVLTPLWGKATPLSKKRRLRWRCASLFHQLLCHHENLSVAAVSCSCLTDAIPQRIIGQTRFILKILLDKIIDQDIIVHWLQVVPEVTVCMDTYTVPITACLVTSTLFANGTVTRQSLHVRRWCSCLDIYGTMVNTSSIAVTLRD